ncbi:DNA polymerase III subunit gamma/tau [uncultured Tyzzerella sp.]|uniref:DNA polymerase III subunit gamma/tau n=1 Tax=uncultured Tyzzerella sp. TaxID=2321398 RepID=UPI002942AE82|nr:DNA polymerase III subunit gamma/tau [uncultured Tyzzerella sp.]
MDYIALYRKLRPKSFEQVIGQKNIVKTLKNQIETNRISHSYLFCGTRGTGKTSTAKIFAKLLNCKEPVNSSPCNKCSMCVSFDENRNLNIVEIDAASNNGVDDIREIREEIKYPPTDGKYKIYIIDEVHMLSIGAFNALLKTLEEPPSYVIFILATTDPHKIPVTILSRCQRFDFKRISNIDMVEAIKVYMKDENIDIEEEALYYIAKISDGAMRDALSILDQCISFYCKEKITLEKVLETVGAVDDEIFFRFIDAIINFYEIEVLSIIDEMIQNGRDINQFVSDLINHIRNLLIATIHNNNEESSLDISKEKLERLKNQASGLDRQYLIKLIDEFSKIQATLKYAFDERIVLEAGCIKLCSAVLEEDITDIKQKISFLEKKLQESNNKTIYIQKNEKEDTIKEKIEEIKPRELAVSEDLKVAIDNYKMLINKFKEPEKVYLQQAMPKSLEDKFLYLVCNDAFVGRLENIKNNIEEALFELFNKKYEIRVISRAKYDIEYKKVISSEPKTQNDINIEDVANLFPEGIVNIE